MKKKVKLIVTYNQREEMVLDHQLTEMSNYKMKFKIYKKNLNIKPTMIILIM